MEIAGLSLISLIVAFGFGALSFISPCVLPLLPGYLSLMTGFSVADLKEGEADTARVVRSTLLFIAGFSLVFVLLGAGASLFGSWINPRLSEIGGWAGWLVIVFGMFIAITAIWTPSALLPVLRERRMEVRPSRLGAMAPPLMGVAFGFGWTPCIGPILGSILTIASANGRVGEGIVLLLSYSLGLGVPFLAVSIFTKKLFVSFDRIKKYLTPITVASGLALAGFGVLMVTGQITELSAWFTQLLERIGLEELTVI